MHLLQFKQRMYADIRTMQKKRRAFRRIQWEEPMPTINMSNEKMIRKENRKGSKVLTAMKEFKDFCDKTGLHGLKFAGDPYLTFGERIFWIVAFLTGVVFASYFIFNIYDKYDHSPVIISTNPEAMSIASIPFPSVMICSLNQATKREANKIIANGSSLEKKLLEDYCNSNNTLSNHSVENDEMARSWKFMKKFLVNVSEPCAKILKTCRWNSNKMNCTQMFKTAYTDDGICCMFNRLPLKYILNIVDEEEEEEYPAVDWNAYKGFETDTSPDAVPWRPGGAGVNFGLTIVADNAIENYYCSSTSSLGFKIKLSNPIEVPKMANTGFLISPGTESRVIIKPSFNDATMSVQNIDIHKRQCYFPYEKPLYFFRVYTEDNCRLECEANYTFQECKCIPYYLPRSPETPICGKTDEQCSTHAAVVVGELTINGTKCDCLPGCFELSYSKTISYGKLTNKFEVKERIVEGTDLDYFMKNMAVMHFFFDDTQFRKFTKSELYGFTEFLSNTGGLLGLFLGFSFLSIVEIIYYLSLKIICKTLKRDHSCKKSKEVSSKVYPFTK